jgi:hypothetical protein
MDIFFSLSALIMESRVVVFAPFKVIESAQEMLRGEIITFFESDVLFRTSLKISKANELPDSINDTCFKVRSIGTGWSGSLSEAFSQETKISENAKEATSTGFNILFFIMLCLDRL